MTQIYNAPLNTDFLGTFLQANGTAISGNSAPTGILDRLDIIGGAARLTLYGTDAETFFGHRTEIVFGTFPNSGEVWSSVDFMIDPLWETTTVASLGSWYPTPDAGEESIIKHVNIGFRLVDRYTFFVNVPDAVLPNGITSNGRVMAVRKIEHGVWYNVTIRVNLQTNNTGWREVYLNGVKIFGEYNVPTAYTDALGPYFKMGPRTPNSQDYEFVRMWVRNAKQWTGNKSFSTVIGNVPTVANRVLTM